MTADEILNVLSAHKDALHGFGVRKLGLFGSFARNNARTDSDVDFIAVLQPKTLNNLLGLKFYLEDLFSRRVDVVLEHLLRPEIRARVEAETLYVTGL